jgi:Acetyltransferases, including N-acetylases of ribosomal proteins
MIDLKTEIRLLNKDDAKTSYKWRNDSQVWALTGSKPLSIVTQQMEEKWLEAVLEKKDQVRFAIIEKKNGAYIGNIYLTDIKEKSAQYQIFIGEKDYWGKNHAYEASILLIKYAKDNLFLEKLYLEVRIEHKKAIRLYEKLGFNIIHENNTFYTMELWLTAQ